MSTPGERSPAKKTTPPAASADMGALGVEIREMIEAARGQVAQVVNAGLTLLHWQIGDRIRREILREARAEYGAEIVSSLSKQLEAEFGRGFGRRNLFHMVRFAEVFPDLEIVQSLIAQLGWTHFLHLIALDDPLKRDFYTEMCRMERWSTRTLRQKINGMLYERTALSKKPEQLIRKELDELRAADTLTPDLVFRDPYVLDFLGLADSYSEKDLESAILAELQRFIIEMGSDFAFLARQKRITIDSRDYYIDLLFYHRRLKCLVAIDLKLGEFDAAFKGQMELYLRYLEKHERVEGENTPVGLILCTGKNEEHVELLQLDRSNIRVAEYLTALPPRETLRAKLHQSIEIARQRLAGRKEEA